MDVLVSKLYMKILIWKLKVKKILYYFIYKLLDSQQMLYDLKSAQIMNRMRFGRFLTMDLPMEGETKYKIEQNKQILLQVIEGGSLKGITEMEDLIKNGYLVRAEYDIQAGNQSGKTKLYKYSYLDSADEEQLYFEKRVSIEEMKATSDNVVDPHSYYLLNSRKFIHNLRNEELKNLCGAKLDIVESGGSKTIFGIGRLIVSLFLDESKYTEKSEVFGNSEILSFTQIREKLRKILNVFEGILEILLFFSQTK